MGRFTLFPVIVMVLLTFLFPFSENDSQDLQLNVKFSSSNGNEAFIDSTSVYYFSSDVSPNGDIHAVWLSSGYDLIHAIKTNGIWTTSIVAENIDIRTLSMDIDSNGEIHLCYSIENWELKYANYDGNSWSATSVDDERKVGEGCSITTEQNGHIHIAYLDSNDYGDGLGGLKYATYNGLSWSHSTVESMDTEWSDGTGGKTSIGVDSYGNIHITYWNFESRYLSYATLPDWKSNHNTDSWYIEQIQYTGNDDGGHSQIIDSEDFVHIAYVFDIDYNDYVIIHCKYEVDDESAGSAENGWVCQTVMESFYNQEFSDPKLFIDNLDIPGIFYYDTVSDAESEDYSSTIHFTKQLAYYDWWTDEVTITWEETRLIHTMANGKINEDGSDVDAFYGVTDFDGDVHIFFENNNTDLMHSKIENLLNDFDSDGVSDDLDQCQGYDDSIDVDGDGIADGCDDLIDSDNDGVSDDLDQCQGYDDSIDVDGDGIADGCDDLIDSDNDGVSDDLDQCQGYDDSIDVDGDGIADGCDDLIDSDNDGVGDNADAFPNDANETADTDNDGVGDNADAFPDDSDKSVLESKKESEDTPSLSFTLTLASVLLAGLIYIRKE